MQSVKKGRCFNGLSIENKKGTVTTVPFSCFLSSGRWLDGPYEK